MNTLFSTFFIIQVLVFYSGCHFGINCDKCDLTGSATYGVGMCIEQSNCPTLYKAGLCSEKQTGVECCFCPTEDHKFSQDEADKIIKAADINVSSSHHCTDRQNSTCTSLDQIRCKSIVGIINFRDRSNCTVTITGGTEVGHMNATQSHYTGFKFDIRMNVCVNTYITTQYTSIENRSFDNATQYIDNRGNIYAKESNHWDILFI